MAIRLKWIFWTLCFLAVAFAALLLRSYLVASPDEVVIHLQGVRHRVSSGGGKLTLLGPPAGLRHSATTDAFVHSWSNDQVPWLLALNSRILGEFPLMDVMPYWQNVIKFPHKFDD